MIMYWRLLHFREFNCVLPSTTVIQFHAVYSLKPSTTLRMSIKGRFERETSKKKQGKHVRRTYEINTNNTIETR
jgi:hypothetical protein